MVQNLKYCQSGEYIYLSGDVEYWQDNDERKMLMIDGVLEDVTIHRPRTKHIHSLTLENFLNNDFSLMGWDIRHIKLSFDYKEYTVICDKNKTWYSVYRQVLTDVFPEIKGADLLQMTDTQRWLYMHHFDYKSFPLYEEVLPGLYRRISIKTIFDNLGKHLENSFNNHVLSSITTRLKKDFSNLDQNTMLIRMIQNYKPQYQNHYAFLERIKEKSVLGYQQLRNT